MGTSSRRRSNNNTRANTGNTVTTRNITIIYTGNCNGNNGVLYNNCVHSTAFSARRGQLSSNAGNRDLGWLLMLKCGQQPARLRV